MSVEKAVAIVGIGCRFPGGVSDAAILYFHGGGYIMGSPASHMWICSHLALLTGCPVLSVDYALAPEHPHPAAVVDGVHSYRWLVSSGIMPSRLAIAGDSAGGGLTIATLMKLRDEGDVLPACLDGERARTREGAVVGPCVMVP